MVKEKKIHFEDLPYRALAATPLDDRRITHQICVRLTPDNS